MANYWLAFITGLTTGGVSCFAVQGGLLTSALATEEEINISKNMRARALVAFLVSKLIAYTTLGLILGLIGSSLIVTPRVQGWLQIIIGIYMIITAANLANIHPFFRHFVITPPKFIFKILRNQTKVKSFFTPILLGALTIFIPCGVTQAMMLLAVSAGNPVISASILFAFILGTIPVFFVIGMAANELFKRKALAIIAALVVAGMGIVSINSGQVLRGSVHTIQNYWKVAFESSESGKSAPVNSGVQEVTIYVSARGYKTDVNTLKLGVPVKLTLITNGVASCARAFTIPDYNLFKLLPQTGTETMEFTPTKTGILTYTCSMGMYSGSFNVIK
jgi:sulfite exporter TauE/SafE